MRRYFSGDLRRPAIVAVDGETVSDILRRINAGEFDAIIDEQRGDALAVFEYGEGPSESGRFDDVPEEKETDADHDR